MVQVTFFCFGVLLGDDFACWFLASCADFRLRVKTLIGGLRIDIRKEACVIVRILVGLLAGIARPCRGTGCITFVRGCFSFRAIITNNRMLCIVCCHRLPVMRLCFAEIAVANIAVGLFSAGRCTGFLMAGLIPFRNKSTNITQNFFAIKSIILIYIILECSLLPSATCTTV